MAQSASDVATDGNGLPTRIGGDAFSANLSEAPYKMELQDQIRGVSVIGRVADKAGPRTMLLLPGGPTWRDCIPFNRFRNRAQIGVNNWNGKSGTLVLGSYETLEQYLNTVTNIPYVQGLSGAVYAITVGTSNHIPWEYHGAGALSARYFGPVTAKLWLSVLDYTFASGTPV